MRECLLDKKQEKVWKVKNVDMACLNKQTNRTTFWKNKPCYQS